MQISHGFYYIQILHTKSAYVFYLAKTVLTLNRSVACTVDGPPKFRTVTMCGRFKYWIVKIKPAFRYTDVDVNRDTFTLHDLVTLTRRHELEPSVQELRQTASTGLYYRIKQHKNYR